MSEHRPKTDQPSGCERARPTEYTEEIGDAICMRLVDDESLHSICAEPGMPDLSTIQHWISHNAEFREIYALAREFQAQCTGDDAIDLADEPGTRWVEKVRANGRVVRSPDRKHHKRIVLRIAVRQWVVDELLACIRRLRSSKPL